MYLNPSDQTVFLVNVQVWDLPLLFLVFLSFVSFRYLNGIYVQFLAFLKEIMNFLEGNTCRSGHNENFTTCLSSFSKRSGEDAGMKQIPGAAHQ